jgi:hypothetical protein
MATLAHRTVARRSAERQSAQADFVPFQPRFQPPGPSRREPLLHLSARLSTNLAPSIRLFSEALR